MILVSPGKNLLARCLDTPPAFTPLFKAIEGSLSGVAFPGNGRHQVGDGLAMARDGDCFSGFDAAKEVRKMGLGLGSCDFVHLVYDWLN